MCSTVHFVGADRVCKSYGRDLLHSKFQVVCPFSITLAIPKDISKSDRPILTFAASFDEKLVDPTACPNWRTALH
jgi:hypothetical protein